MPRLTATVTRTPEVTTTVKQEVKLKPGLKIALLNELRAYEQEYIELKAMEETLERRKERIMDLRNSTGESELMVDDFKTQMIAGESTSRTVKSLLAAGVTMKQIEKATKKTPKKPYELISSPRLAEDSARRKALKKAKGEDNDDQD